MSARRVAEASRQATYGASGETGLGTKDTPRAESVDSRSETDPALLEFRRDGAGDSAAQGSGGGGPAVPYRTAVWDVLREAFPVLFGDVLEWYEWSAFGYMSSHIENVFFPEDVSKTAVWAVFALPFLVRPVGGVIMGWIADRYGRKPALLVSLLGMIVVTFCQGCLIGGAVGTALLVGLRVAQGIFIGGESSGTVVYLSETKNRQVLGFAACLIVMTGATGFLAANLLCAVLSATLTPLQMDSWGWRLPFLLSILPGTISAFLRWSIEETHEFTAMGTPTSKAGSSDQLQVKYPVLAVLKHYPLQFIVCFMNLFGSAATVYVGGAWTISWLHQYCGLSETQALSVALLTSIVAVLGAPLGGIMMDTRGVLQTNLFSCLLMLLLTMPCYLLFHADAFKDSRVVSSGLGMVGLGLSLASTGANGLFCAEAFPTSVRGTGVGLAWNTAFGLIGGLGPLLCSSSLPFAGEMVGAYYITASAAVSLVSVLLANCLNARGTVLSHIRPELY